MAQVMAGQRPGRGGYVTGTSAVPERAAGRALLWGPDDLLRWGITVGVGALVVAVAWYICAGDVSFSQQIGPTDVAVLGLLLAGLGNVRWLLRGRRALGERRCSLLPDVPVAEESLAEPVLAASVVDPPDIDPTVTDPYGTEVAVTDSALYLGGAGMERYHQSDCFLATGRPDFVALTRGEHEQAGRLPCGVCRP
jgi:hypothetical protein